MWVTMPAKLVCGPALVAWQAFSLVVFAFKEVVTDVTKHTGLYSDGLLEARRQVTGALVTLKFQVVVVFSPCAFSPRRTGVLATAGCFEWKILHALWTRDGVGVQRAVPPHLVAQVKTVVGVFLLFAL
jgi:hypothetical protein